MGDLLRPFARRGGAPGLSEVARDQRAAGAGEPTAPTTSDLSVSMTGWGDLFRALGQGEEARQAFRSRSRSESGWRAEPDRADYQRDLSVSGKCDKPVPRPRPGQGRARPFKVVAIFERLAQAEPDRADYQRDPRCPATRWRPARAPARARRRARPQKSLAIAERLACRPSPTALTTSAILGVRDRMGDLFRALARARRRATQPRSSRGSSCSGDGRSR